MKLLLVGDTVIMLGGGETKRMSENNNNNKIYKKIPLYYLSKYQYNITRDILIIDVWIFIPNEYHYTIEWNKYSLILIALSKKKK